ncbi:MAG: hypothetical protein F6K39_09845 [Okeania sp. SIO3B3]|nr:hypothetical protein [Okeania sp. SIO3B3]
MSILEKLEKETILDRSELDWLEENQLTETFSIAEKQKQNKENEENEVKRLENEFLYLKEKYKVPKNVEYSFLHELLFKLDTENKLTNSEIQLLKYYNLNETLAIANQIQEFAKLKIKYHATKYQDFFPDTPLFPILKKIYSANLLTTKECNWLSNNGFLETLEIYSGREKQKQKRKFAILKKKYKVTEFEDSLPDSNLYKILQKVEQVEGLTEVDIDWLKLHGLTEIIKVAEEKYLEKDWIRLQDKYVATVGELKFDPFYNILSKLDKGERLDKLMVTQLKTENLLTPGSKITTTYYWIEASFFEKEFKRTKDKWLIPKISS